ncbi:hypothetical protein ACH0B5_07385 [Ureibacillus sp. 179-F W5.1 NHS]|uniref:Stage III sporulation protein AG n=1 Tax=Lysinibacillus halotolerans TaxID=1368476 RepID=A0A3M8H9T3_9BACI|nr:hypothetical protein [Lysinibacillus halotolerans]RNC99197.1 hypothetical protein EC501_08490 [Lysinibacillus halotolerans]
MEKKWSKQKLIFIPIAVLVFIAYISVTLNDPKEEQYNSSEEESKLEQTLSQIKGVGQVKVYFHYDVPSSKDSNADSLLNGYLSSSENQQHVSGLLVVSEGASNPAIQKQLLETISRVMQMPTHRIMIVPMESKGDEQ